MTAKQLFQAGQLNEAIKALGAEVRDNPTDPRRRTFLFELLCFAGEYDRAEKHLHVLAQGNSQAEMGAVLYFSALHAERTRLDKFTNETLSMLAPGRKFSGTLNGRPFESIVDADPRIGPRLEIFAAGAYMWIPFEHIESIELQAPSKLRDLLWSPALVRTGPSFKDKELGEILIPVQYPRSFAHPNDNVRLGRETHWQEVEGGEPIPVGQKLFLVDGEEFPLLEVRKIEFHSARISRGVISMPLRDDILNPIPGSNPGGESLRYAPVYDKIKEARRQDDEGPMGDWQRERKVADWTLVIKLGSEAIATKSKDLQLAVWLTEALLHKEGFSGLQSGLDLIKGLIENFWDGMYPELDDGDSEMRAAPLDWLGAHYLEVPLKRVPLTKSGLNFLDYHKAKKVGREADSQESYEKGEAFQAAVAAGELTLDDWDKAFNATSRSSIEPALRRSMASLNCSRISSQIAEEKFGAFVPSFSKLRSILEEVRHQANSFLQTKLETDPDEPVDTGWGNEAAEAEVTEEVEVETAEAVSSSGAAAAPARARARPKGSLSPEPADRDDAIERVASAARFWRTEDPYSPAPYIMLRGMRWGELRAAEALDAGTFEAPSSDTRTNLKRLLMEGNYAEAIEVAETAMATPAGRAWLDLQRYIVTAAEGLGYTAIAEAIKSELAALLKSYPDLLTSSLLDDTPCANNETQEWVKTFADSSSKAAAPMPVWEPRYEEPETQAESGDAAEKAPDAFELAMEAARSGRQQDAFEILIREASHQNSGRGRFQRRLQLAQVCLSTGAEAIAFPILQELAATISKHQLEEWESPDMVAHAFALLYRCMENGAVSEEEKKTLYSKICRLDPVQALAHSR